MLNLFKEEIKAIIKLTKQLDKKVTIIFLSVAVLQTISWYYTSKRFFVLNFYTSPLDNNTNADLIGFLYWFIGDFFTLFILPVVIIKFILKEKLKNYGINFGKIKIGVTYSIFFLIILIPIVWIITAQLEFADVHPFLQSANNNWLIFSIFESGLFIYMFAWEFIWRGFMLFGLEEKFGFYAVFIQMIPFVILHNGTPAFETFSAIIGGIILGFLAFRTRSFLYGVLIHFILLFSIDLISVLRYRAGNYGIGFESLIHIFSKAF